jgi:large subunit ribosomal protein L30
MAAELEITYVKSAIGYSERQKRTVRALGLRKLHDSVRQPDNPSVRGMIHSVQHLLSYREVEGEDPVATAQQEVEEQDPVALAQRENVGDEPPTMAQQGSTATIVAGQKGDIT